MALPAETIKATDFSMIFQCTLAVLAVLEINLDSFQNRFRGYGNKPALHGAEQVSSDGIYERWLHKKIQIRIQILWAFLN